MTDEVRQRRAAAYSDRETLLRLRASLFVAAEAQGCGPDDHLPEPLAAAHDAYSARISVLSDEIVELDQQIAANGDQG